MEKFFGIILIAVVLEGIITYIKTFCVECKLQWQMIVAVVLGIVIAIAYDIDLLAIFGLVSKIPFAGNVLTGILISRGSNYIFDLIKNISSYKSEK